MRLPKFVGKRLRFHDARTVDVPYRLEKGRDRRADTRRRTDAPRVKILLTDHKTVDIAPRADEGEDRRLVGKSLLDLLHGIDGWEDVWYSDASGGDESQERFLFSGDVGELGVEGLDGMERVAIARDGRERVEFRHNRGRRLHRLFEIGVRVAEGFARVSDRLRRQQGICGHDVTQREESSSKGLRREEAFAAYPLGDLEGAVFQIAIHEELKLTFVRVDRRDHLDCEGFRRVDGPVDDGRFAQEIFVKIRGVSRSERAVGGEAGLDVRVKFAQLTRPGRMCLRAFHNPRERLIPGVDPPDGVHKERREIIPAIRVRRLPDLAAHGDVKRLQPRFGALDIPRVDHILEQFERERRLQDLRVRDFLLRPPIRLR